MLEALVGAALRSLFVTGVVWLGVKASRLRDPRGEMTAWTIVLAVSLAMPAAARIALDVAPPAPLSAPAVDQLLPPWIGLGPRPRSEAGASLTGAAASAADEYADRAKPGASAGPSASFDWRWPTLLVYLIVSGVLLAKLAVGLVLTGRVARSARPVREDWTEGRDIRVSSAIASPATFGSIILLPEDYAEWRPSKRAAVVAHEEAHVRRGDFYVQLAASMNKAVFWFNPSSWWLRRRLCEIAEVVSDDEAARALGDRPLYARILLEVSSRSPIPPAAVAMARPAMIGARIERILSETPAFPAIGKRARVALAAAILPFAIVAAAPFATTSTQATTEETPSVDQQQAPHAPITIAPALLDADVGFYEDKANATVMTVTREGDHLVSERTGKSPVAEYPFTDHDFFMTIAAEQDAFIAEASGRVVRVVHRKNGLATLWERVAPETAAAIDADFERHVAEELAPRALVKIDPSLLDRYVGYYQLTPTFYFTITREGDQLFAQCTNQKKFAVFPYSDRDFFYTVVAAQLSFQTASEGVSPALILHQDGKDRVAKRVTAEAARAFQQRLEDQLKPRTAAPIDASLLDRFVGRYTSPTISITVTRSGDRLYAQVLGYTRFRVYPYTHQDFFATTIPAQFSFTPGSGTKAAQLTRHQHGVDLVLNRLD